MFAQSFVESWTLYNSQKKGVNLGKYGLNWLSNVRMRTLQLQYDTYPPLLYLLISLLWHLSRPNFGNRTEDRASHKMGSTTIQIVLAFTFQYPASTFWYEKADSNMCVNGRNFQGFTWHNLQRLPGKSKNNHWLILYPFYVDQFHDKLIKKATPLGEVNNFHHDNAPATTLKSPWTKFTKRYLVHQQIRYFTISFSLEIRRLCLSVYRNIFQWWRTPLFPQE